MTFDGRRVLVTGAAGGIGAAIARAFVAEGAAVLGCDVEEGPATHEWVHADLAVLGDLDRVVARATASGGCDVIVNCAAIVQLDDPARVTIDEFTSTFDVNVRAAWYLAVQLAPVLAARGHGSVVNLGSTHPRTTKRGSFPYNASKGAVLALTTALAVDLGERGIRVNAVSPGIVDTEPTRRWIASTDDPAATRSRLAGDHPLGRMPTVDDVAAAVTFLASDAAAGISGIDLVVDAGRQAMRH